MAHFTLVVHFEISISLSPRVEVRQWGQHVVLITLGPHGNCVGGEPTMAASISDPVGERGECLSAANRLVAVALHGFTSVIPLPLTARETEAQRGQLPGIDRK